MKKYINTILLIILCSLLFINAFEGKKVDGELYTDSGFSVVHGAGDVGNYFTLVGWTTDNAKNEYLNCTLTDSGFTGLQPGVYDIQSSLSFDHTATNLLAHVSCFIDDTEDISIESERVLATANDAGFTGPGGRTTITSTTEIIKLKLNVDKAGTAAFNHANFRIERIR